MAELLPLTPQKPGEGPKGPSSPEDTKVAPIKDKVNKEADPVAQAIPVIFYSSWPSLYLKKTGKPTIKFGEDRYHMTADEAEIAWLRELADSYTEARMFSIEELSPDEYMKRTTLTDQSE